MSTAMRPGARGAAIETAALLGTAILVRALLPDASFFGPDQVGVLVEARGVLAGHWFPPGPGIGWTPFKLGPLFEWVTALGLLPRNEFADVILLIAVIHGFSVLGWRRLFAEVSGPVHAREARMAGWALALHPMAISSGCAPISTSIVMPTTLLFVWGNLLWFRSRSPLGFALACVGAALMAQAHATASFLLPLLVVGFWKRAPIGRSGLAGLALAIVVVLPMAIPNLRVLSAGAIQHAGSEGAPFVVALGRAVVLELRSLDIAASISAPWRPPAQAAALVWVVFLLVGAVALVRRRDDGTARSLVLFGLVVDTVCVVLLPRGALLLYLDATLPFRCWSFAAGACALSESAKRVPTRAAEVAIVGIALAAVVTLAAFTVASRFATHALGFARINLASLDMREPLGPPRDPIGVLTLGSFRDLGRALHGLGVTPESVERAWHGPWRWAGAQSAGVWIDEARGTDARGAPGSPRSFVVLHEDDDGAVPRSAPVRAGRFRVHPFDDRLHIVSDDGAHFAATVDGGAPQPTTVQIVTESTRAVTRLHGPSGDAPLARTASGSGFLVWSASIAAADGATLSAELGAGGAGAPILQMRTVADAYAFAAPD